MAGLPSEEELKEAVTAILQTSDLEKITLRMVMTMLSDKFDIDVEQLAPRKRTVRQIINEFLENSYDPNENVAAASAAAAEQQRAKGRKRAREEGGVKPVRLTGLERAVVLAEPLAKFLGAVVIPRAHIPKRISAYAKEHNLQDEQDRRKILCDDKLKEALGVEEFTFFSLAKLVSGLVYKPEECEAELQEMAKKCEEDYLEEKMRKLKEEDGGEGGGKKKVVKKQKAKVEGKERKPSGLLKPMQLSAALSAVCGESQLSRSEVLKKIWVYIRENQLKDPNDAKRVLCDDKLKAVFEGNDSVGNMGINKFLSAHMTKIE